MYSKIRKKCNLIMPFDIYINYYFCIIFLIIMFLHIFFTVFQRLGVCDFPIRVECNNTVEMPAPTPPVTQPSTPASPINVPVTPDANLQLSTSSGDKKMTINKMEYNSQSECFFVFCNKNSRRVVAQRHKE